MVVNNGYKQHWIRGTRYTLFMGALRECVKDELKSRLTMEEFYVYSTILAHKHSQIVVDDIIQENTAYDDK